MMYGSANYVKGTALELMKTRYRPAQLGALVLVLQSERKVIGFSFVGNSASAPLCMSKPKTLAKQMSLFKMDFTEVDAVVHSATSRLTDAAGRSKWSDKFNESVFVLQGNEATFRSSMLRVRTE
jgi:hypothetical protein